MESLFLDICTSSKARGGVLVLEHQERLFLDIKASLETGVIKGKVLVLEHHGRPFFWTSGHHQRMEEESWL